MISQAFSKLVLASISLVLLSSCANTFRGDVITFHEGPLPDGETIRVEPMDPEKEGSLEFRRYANLIGEQLEDIGYTAVSDPEREVDLVAEVDYSVELAPTDLRLDASGPFYARYHFYTGRYYDPFHFGLSNHWEPLARSSPTYVRRLQMNIVEAEEEGEEGERIFEGTVRSTGLDGNLPEIMPYLVTAMFANYPGEDGVTKVVTLERDQ